MKILLIILIYLQVSYALNANPADIENKIPDTVGFITDPEFNRFTKIIFYIGVTEAAKKLVAKSR